jgi:hypothetical protein
MKKYIFIGFMILTVAMFFGCWGQPERESGSTTQSMSFILNGNFGSVEYELFEAISDQQLMGTWQAKNEQQNASSKIQFTEEGRFQENVYSDLTNELLATYEGSYTATNNLLIVSLSTGESYRFMYTLSGDYLKISQ